MLLYAFMVAAGTIPALEVDVSEDETKTKAKAFVKEDIYQAFSTAKSNQQRNWLAGLRLNAFNLMPMPDIVNLFNEEHQKSPENTSQTIETEFNSHDPKTNTYQLSYKIEDKKVSAMPKV